MTNAEKSGKLLRHWVFWPPFVLIVTVLIISIIYPEQFVSFAARANAWILESFGWLFSYTALLLFLLCILIFISPIGKIRLGGPAAKPFFSRWKWFAIILCTTIATGILFWSTSEPLYHYAAPPASMAIEPESREAVIFSLSTLFLHWSFTPYAIYAIPALVFAIAFYNGGSVFSLSGMLKPLISRDNKVGVVLDMVCLYALVLGMAASLGAGILMVSGGLRNYLVMENETTLLLLVTLIIVVSFVVSAATGLFRGIKYLSMINLVIFIVLILYVALYAPWSAFGEVLPYAMKDFIITFFEKSLFTGEQQNDPWPKEWTVFYWANWMAWAPITALFLGRLAKGRTVREFLVYNWILPSLFAIVWMSVFGGSILAYENDSTGIMTSVLWEEGPNAVVYVLFRQLPYFQVVIPLFLFLVYISYVTAADSNTEAIGGLCTKNFYAEMMRPLLGAKLIWGILIGLMSFIMISSTGVDGIRILSNLGGVPALFLLVLISVNAVILVIRSFRR